MPEPHAALLLDLDGTLVDSESFHRDVYRSWFSARGWPVREDLLAGFAGRRADDVLATEPGPWAGEDVAAMTAELLAHVGTLPRPALAAGAAELVTTTRLPLGLVTSATIDWARTCLGGLLDRFDVVITRDEVDNGKPHPEPYALATRSLGVPPAACVAVEDAPAGIASAIAAGIGLVVAVTGTFTASELATAHRVVAGLDEVAPLL
ncbi:MAG: HAD family phosphatase [Propionicimonas sp.]|uniref:HAD family hydrolase n=1 Tax=Propionicimonas sp. TaxID=1955623 RepID=UPI003D0CAC51